MAASWPCFAPCGARSSGLPVPTACAVGSGSFAPCGALQSLWDIGRCRRPLVDYGRVGDIRTRRARTIQFRKAPHVIRTRPSQSIQFRRAPHPIRTRSTQSIRFRREPHPIRTRPLKSIRFRRAPHPIRTRPSQSIRFRGAPQARKNLSPRRKPWVWSVLSEEPRRGETAPHDSCKVRPRWATRTRFSRRI